ncbi:MAG: beta-lactamase family protein [Acidobacteria bacterium]|nr:beta-lactamase family protein [Acidobacteriota bacterium]
MKKLTPLLLAAAALLLAAPPVPVVVKDAARTGLDPARLARIPARLRQFVDSGQAAGMVTLVARRGQVASLGAIGYTDFDSKTPIQTDAIFQLHSMTKPIVCMGVLQLAEEGKVALTDPVEKHLPEFRGLMVGGRPAADGSRTLVKPARPVTLRDLMTHTGGMMLNPPPGIGELHGALHKPLADVALIYSQQPLLFQPGTEWSYSNAGIAVLARIIEVHSSLPFEKYLEARIFKPLGMNDTFIFPPTATHHRMPVAYLLKDGKPVKYTMDPLGEGAMKFRVGARYSLPEGGLYSTAADLFRLYQAMLNKGQLDGQRILSPAAIEVMTANHTGSLKTSQPGAGWGLGNFVLTEPAAQLSLASLGSYGHGGRYGTFYLVDPAKQMISIFLIHREGGSAERQAFIEMAYASMVD